MDTAPTFTCSVFIAASVDGFIARPDGDVAWLTPSGDAATEDGEDYGYGAFFASVDALVMGRHSFEKVLSFGTWPYEGKRVVVLSSKPHTPPDHLEGKVEVLAAEPAEVATRLALEGARHLYIDGGVTIQRFLQAGLIRDLTLTRIPILLGRGIPLFGDLDRDVRLEHLETLSFKSGLVQSKYRVRHQV